MTLDGESNVQGLKLEFTGVKIIESINKEIIWWSFDHSEELKSFARSDLNTEVFTAKLRIYTESFKAEKDKDKARVYITMLHQLYFELLEYQILLLKSFTDPIEILPISISKPTTREIVEFAEKILKDNKFEEVDGKAQISGMLVALAKKTVDCMEISEKYHELVILPIYLLLDNSIQDFLDEHHRNVYNSIKHGNRGKSSDGRLILSTKDQEKTNLFDTDYSYDHSRITKINNDKNHIVLKPVTTFIDSGQLIERCKIILSYINVIHSIYIKMILNEGSEESIDIYDQQVIQEAWSGKDKNGHMFDNNIVQFNVKDRDKLIAEATTNISMEINVRFLITYDSALYEELKVLQENEKQNGDVR